MSDLYNQIAIYIREHIRRARDERGISQADLAQALGKTNVSVSDIERGKVGVSAVNLILIAKKLGRDVNYFVGRPYRVRVPKDELSPEETQLLYDFRRMDNFELQGTVRYLVARLADFSQKGDFKRLVDEASELTRRATARD